MRGSVVLIAAAMLLCAGVARADDKVAAEELFLRGKELKKQGKVAEACDAFARSQALDPQIGTQYNLALCYEEEGRLASAWALFREVAQRDTNAKRKKDADTRARQLHPRLTKMLINLEGPAIPGLVVHRGADDVTPTVGIETAVDRGDYVIRAEAPGHKPFETEVRANGEGVTVTVTIPTLEPESAETPVATTEPAAAAPEPAGPADSPARSSGRGRRTLGLVVGGAGVAVAGTGVVFGVLARGDWSDARAICGDDLACDSDADLMRSNQLADDARSKGNLATILVGAGVAAIATGAVLWLTAPGDAPGDEHALRITPSVGPDGAFVSLSGVLR